MLESTFKKENSGDYGKEVPPVPIPNTVVKLFHVEDTWRVTARENRSSPEHLLRDNLLIISFFMPVLRDGWRDYVRVKLLEALK